MSDNDAIQSLTQERNDLSESFSKLKIDQENLLKVFFFLSFILNNLKNK